MRYTNILVSFVAPLTKNVRKGVDLDRGRVMECEEFAALVQVNTR